MTRAGRLAVFGIAAATGLIPVALALRAELQPGLSGGFMGGGVQCTECHRFNSGGGSVTLFGAPQRYRTGVAYDLTVRVTDPEQLAAGFEASVEGNGGHAGTLSLGVDGNTAFGSGVGGADYIAHSVAGVDASIAQWALNGWYDYHFQWQAPPADEGRVTFFVAGNAIDNNGIPDNDRFYATYSTIGYAKPGDSDGDNDVDLKDFAAYQRCYDGGEPMTGQGCEYVDLDTEAFVDALLGPTATQPAGYVLADHVRGGLLYDQWWTAAGLPAPVEDHPLWATRPDPTSNPLTGAATWRCKECHGWDYKGVDGDYGSGDHKTGFGGIFGTTASAQQVFERLLDPGGHAFNTTGLSDEEIWNMVRFVLEGQVDTDTYIDGDIFIANPNDGEADYEGLCRWCHEPGFGDAGYIGDLARTVPREFLHKVRYGQPGSPMPAYELLRWDAGRAATVSAYYATLLAPP